MAVAAPLVSVSMICYNAETYIAAAIEGVLRQQVDFPIELVIGDDNSSDGTRKICAEYAEKYPDIIRLLPPRANLGIGGNTARTMGSCLGKYIAVCDGDDIWADPMKLKRQVEFLEQHPAYGAVYTDVETISETGEPADDPDQDSIREMYAQGEVFTQLLGANFINNSTALFRRELISDLIIAPDRTYQVPDYIRWLHIAARANIHFIDYKSTLYRKHTSGLSVAVPKEKIQGNKRAVRRALYNIFSLYDQNNPGRKAGLERILLFRRIMSLVFIGPGSLSQRLRMLRLAPKYFPGIRGLLHIARSKAGQWFNVNLITINLEQNG